MGECEGQETPEQTRHGSRRVRVSTGFVPACTEQELVMSETKSGGFDPVSLEIYWSRLVSIADEAATGLDRKSVV